VRRIVPIVLVLLTAAPQAALAGEWFRCRYTGETRPACCCGERAQESSGPEQPELRRSSCCEVLHNEPRAESACAEIRGELRASIVPVAVVPALAGLIAAGIASGHRISPNDREAAPPGRSQPLYLTLSSLLL
jgi:hypothetical protein